jgi:hypothetical protein
MFLAFRDKTKFKRYPFSSFDSMTKFFNKKCYYGEIISYLELDLDGAVIKSGYFVNHPDKKVVEL